MNKARPHRPSGKKPQTSAAKLTFFIESMDALGQGVHKEPAQVTFIAKTLPGEKGVARITSQKKGVRFAELDKLEQAATNRIEPSCPHFSQCPGCAYLHTDYPSELNYKKAALAQLLYGLKVDLPEINVSAAPNRLHYRNRVQLHYRHKYIGILDGNNNNVLEVPHCQLPQPELQHAIDQLYQSRDWSKTYTGEGHCELSLIDGQVQEVWNQPYAHGGFTQVNTAMNKTLRALVAELVCSTEPSSVMDLFAGNGNLSDDIVKDAAIKRIMIDVSDNNHADFFQLDLFAEDALLRFKKNTHIKSVDNFLVDPPRKGFPTLNEWVKTFKPRTMVYVSCNAATMARDLKSLSSPYSIEKIHLLDMFPSTKHFESVVAIKFK